METKWFEIWFDDKQAMIETMARNIQSDLDAGYNYYGRSITLQRFDLSEYKAKFELQIDEFKKMTDSEVNRWCYYDLKKRGAIS